MIAAVAQNFGSGKTWFNWFDVALVLVLGFGFWRGRKHGMTKELIPVSFWLAVVIVAGVFNDILGDLFIKWGVIRTVFGTTFNEKTAAYVTSYLLIATIILIIFSFVKKLTKRGMEGSNFFGGSEYYFGIISGVVRYACIVLFFLALINAPFYSQNEIAAKQAYNNRWYGGGMKDFKGDFIPSMDEFQFSVFNASLLGPFIHDWFSAVLIHSVPVHGSNKPSVVDIQR